MLKKCIYIFMVILTVILSMGIYGSNFYRDIASAWFIGVRGSAVAAALGVWFFRDKFSAKIKKILNSQKINRDIKNALVGARSLLNIAQIEIREELDAFD